MLFFDEQPEYLPEDATYYFNILVLCIAISSSFPQKEEVLPNQIEDIWNLEKITDARPYIIHMYLDDELDKDMEYEIFCFPHSVVEIGKDNSICFYDMIDFDTTDPWRID